MEEKNYPIHQEEEESVGMVNEPIAEAAVVSPKTEDGVTTVHDWIDDLDWDKFPSLGPSSEEEAIARIDDFEKRQAEGKVKWISSEDAWKQLYDKYPWLR